MNKGEICCETPEITINRLEEENCKLKEEVRILNNKVLNYKELILHLKMSIDLVFDKVKEE